VAENIALVRGYPRRFGRISWPAVRRQALEALDIIGGGIDPDVKVADLTRADQSLVAIARGVSMNCSVLVLDEPTASLPDDDVQRLFAIIRRLKLNGVSVLYVSHRLDEIRQICDRVTVLRDGRVILDVAVAEISDDHIVEAIVGGAVTSHARRTTTAAQEVVLEVRLDEPAAGLGSIQFNHHRGEILGLAGLRGAGHETVGRSLAGVTPFDSSSITITGVPARVMSVRAAIALGIGFATSRREQEALAMTLTARENFFLNPGMLRRGRARLLTRKREGNAATRLAATVGLRPPAPESIVATFSGGNQQKIVLGRWLSTDLKVLILEEPTMGIDVGARAEIYALMHALADDGLSLLVVSSDFEELAIVCDRTLVFDRGAISADLSGADLTADALTHYASGSTRKGTDS
jgi:ribose transport system ATP-binding protein